MLGPVRTVHVSLGNRSYDIKIARGLINRFGRDCARLKLGARCAIITDTNVGKRYAKTVFNSLATAGFSPSLIIVQPGEPAKSLKTVQEPCNTHGTEQRPNHNCSDESCASARD